MARVPPRARYRSSPDRRVVRLALAADPIQPSNSAAARWIHREPAQGPTTFGRRVSGHAWGSTRSIVSPLASARIVARWDASVEKRCPKSAPVAAKSASVGPAPAPRVDRPSDNMARVMSRWARSTP